MTVRDLVGQDRESWRGLWDGYLRFYEASVEPAVTEHTWRRILDPASPLIGRAAERDGELVGFAISVLHEGTWSHRPLLYLEDLFVDPAARGGGVGRALLEDAVAQAKARGCSRVYWHTHADNAAARRLYDTFVHADAFVRYRLVIDGSPP